MYAFLLGPGKWLAALAMIAIGSILENTIVACMGLLALGVALFIELEKETRL